MKKIFVFIALAVALMGCGAPAVQQKTEITLVESEYKFEPSSITVAAGQPVTLTVKNTGALEHDFVIEKISVKNVATQAESDMDMGMNMTHDMTGMDYDLHLATATGKNGTITFTPLTAGTYQFYCAVKGHKEAGMTGTLVVTAP